MKENMIPFLYLLVIAAVIPIVINGFKKLFKYIVNEEWKRGKFGVPLSIVFGLLYGVTAQIGIVTSLMLLMNVSTKMSTMFVLVDILACSIVLSQGVYGITSLITSFIDMVMKLKELKKKLDDQTNLYPTEEV